MTANPPIFPARWSPPNRKPAASSGGVRGGPRSQRRGTLCAYSLPGPAESERPGGSGGRLVAGASLAAPAVADAAVVGTSLLAAAPQPLVDVPEARRALGAALEAADGLLVLA